ncbi:hypothetical protein MRA01_37360 [Methylobacterium radiotolerans]|nr:hypothetical protein MRA01_37360 [Methylobacterium radiotolerans]
MDLASPGPRTAEKPRRGTDTNGAVAPGRIHNDNGAATRRVTAPLDRAAEGGKTAW